MPVVVVVRRARAAAVAVAAGIAAVTLAACTVSSEPRATRPASSTRPAPPASTAAAAPTAPGTSGAATGTGAGRVILTCSGEPAVAPATYVLTCADANTRLVHLAWSDWGAATAHAHGTLDMNSCTPNCAQGTFHSYPATVTVRGAVQVGPGQVSYTEVQVTAAPLHGNDTWHVPGTDR